MGKIGYIAPNIRMATIASDVFDEHGVEDVFIEIGNIDRGADKAVSLVKEKGVKAFIARGGTALAIRQRLNLPVIEIPIFTEDIARALLKASKFGGTIGVIGFYNLLKGLESFNPLLTVEIRQVYVDNKDELYREVYKAKQEGVKIVIGGAVQCKVARKFGLHSVFIESGPQAIYDAYCQAKALVDTLLWERRKSEEIRAILDYARDGFVAIDNKRKITLINDAASKIIDVDISNAKGRPLAEVCPGLKELGEALITGKEYINDITSIGKTNIIYNRIPIIVHGQIAGAVATFQDINILQEAETKIRRESHESGLYARYTFNDIDGISQEIKKAIGFAVQFAKTESTVLVTGETGTGKELFVQSIHNASNRRKGPFVAVNCASLPQNLLESELFGYVKGAFTGARKKGKAGLFELAHKGTIFLDEVSEIPLELQGRLLRVLQEKSIMRLGDDKIIPVDVRVIAATNRNLVDYVRQGNFREDLFFRLNILSLHLPPLRDRIGDIPILTNRFLEEYKTGNKALKLTEEALNSLIEYRWPGNIRELRNLIERISVLASKETMTTMLIQKFIDDNEKLFGVEEENASINSNPTMEEIEDVLKSVNNNKTRAAKILGVDRTTLWRWLKKHDR